MDKNQEISTIFSSAISNHQLGQLDEAARGYRTILESQPEHPDANHNLGVIAVQLNQPAVGLPYFNQALKSNPTHAQYWISCIDALIRLNRLQEAQSVLTQGRSRGLNGDAVDGLIARLQVDKTAVFSMKSLPKPAKPINKCINKNPIRLPNKNELNNIVALIKQGKRQEAILLAKKNTEKFPDFGQGFKILGYLFTESGDLDAATIALSHAARLLPNDAQVKYNLATIYEREKKYLEAENMYRASIRLKPKFVEAHNNLGNMLAILGRHTDAESHLRLAISFRANFAEAWNNLGNLLKDIKQIEQAESCLNKALSLRPNYAEAFSNLGNVRREKKQIDLAEQSYRQALLINESFADAHNNLANLLKEDRGFLGEAIQSYKRAHFLRPEDAEILVNLGNTFLSRDAINDAVDTYHQAIGLAPISKAFEAASFLAVLYFLNDEGHKSREQLDFSLGLSISLDPQSKNSRIYWNLVDHLLLWHKKNNNFLSCNNKASHLYVIGESHSLSAHRLNICIADENFRGCAEWIPGCKQWHLGSPYLNEYKFKFEAILKRIPKASVILLSIGEIDCRHDEGIISAWRKSPNQSITEIIETTIHNYIVYATENAKKHGHFLIISGVPMPNIAMASFSKVDRDLLIYVLDHFNGFLRSEAKKFGLKFLDLFSLTKSENGRYHLDGYHLTPDAVIEAFKKYLLS